MGLSERYILDEAGNPAPEPDLMKWAAWMENGGRTLANDELSGGVNVSTVFLGLDHRSEGGDPVLWETMIFGGAHDQFQERYISRQDALAGHAKALELAKSSAV